MKKSPKKNRPLCGGQDILCFLNWDPSAGITQIRYLMGRQHQRCPLSLAVPSSPNLV